MTARFPELVVEGTSREMGTQLGELARESLHGFVELATEQVCKSSAGNLESAYDCARASAAAATRFAPSLMEEIQGMADGAGLELEQIMLLQIRNQLDACDSGGCTSVGVIGGDGQRSSRIIGQNWDNDPRLDPFTIVLTRRPATGNDVMTIGQVGLIGYVGVSESGVAICMNSLPAPAECIGVPHYFFVRELYQCNTLEAGLTTLQRGPRALPANLMIATPDGVADLEMTLEEIRVLPTDCYGVVTHSNHCVHPDFLLINDEFAELIDSHARKRRVDALVTDPSHRGVDGITAVLRDHHGFPCSICRHANDDPEFGHWSTVFSVVIDAPEGRMWIARGNPCEASFEAYDLCTA